MIPVLREVSEGMKRFKLQDCRLIYWTELCDIMLWSFYRVKWTMKAAVTYLLLMGSVTPGAAPVVCV